MQIAVGSDIHLEYRGENALQHLQSYLIDADILILAGDILNLINVSFSEQAFDLLCKRYKYVIYVPGNHDFYGTSITTGITLINNLKQKFPNLYPLVTGEIVELEGQRFIGGTMWWTPDPSNYFYRYLLNDFKMVMNVDFESEICHNKFIESVKNNADKDSIIISHHLPHPYSIDSQFKDSVSNRFFVSDQSRLMDLIEPKLWIHGHTHVYFSYKYGNTQVFCNPAGYEHERPKDYKFRLVTL